MDPRPEADQPRRLIQIHVTVVLPRRLVWLLAGIAAANLLLPDELLEKASLILRAFVRLAH